MTTTEVENTEEIFLKTIIPSRKANKKCPCKSKSGKTNETR
jgi:hypothetical protein